MLDGARFSRSWKNLESTTEADEVSIGKLLGYLFLRDGRKRKGEWVKVQRDLRRREGK